MSRCALEGASMHRAPGITLRRGLVAALAISVVVLGFPKVPAGAAPYPWDYDVASGPSLK